MQVISDELHNPEVHVPSSDLLTLSVFFQAKAEDSLTRVSPARSTFFQMNWKK